MGHYSRKFNCSECGKLFVRFFFSPPKRTREKDWVCSGCRQTGITDVFPDDGQPEKLSIDLGGLNSERRCENCKHFQDCPGSNQWWKKCAKGYVSPQIFDDDTKMELVYFEDVCPEFEPKDE